MNIGYYLDNHREQKEPQPTIGWTYTEEDERQIKRACRGAIAFMRNYGKGERSPMVNLKYYENVLKTNNEQPQTSQ